jgi:hypothetical protein
MENTRDYVKKLLDERKLAKEQGTFIKPETEIGLMALENHLTLHETLLDLIKNQDKHEDSLQGLGASVSFLGQAEAYNDGLKKAAKMLANNYPLKGLLNG